MNRRVGAAGLAAAAVIAFQPAAANADPAFMGHTEWQNVNEGQTLSKVKADCACTGAWNGNTGLHNGNSYKQRWFSSAVGTAFVWFRMGSDGAWHVGWGKDWCPGWNQSVPYSGCDHVSFG